MATARGRDVPQLHLDRRPARRLVQSGLDGRVTLNGASMGAIRGLAAEAIASDGVEAAAPEGAPATVESATTGG